MIVGARRILLQSNGLDLSELIEPQIAERQVAQQPWVFVFFVLAVLVLGFIRALASTQHRWSLSTGFIPIHIQLERWDLGLRINPMMGVQLFFIALVYSLGIFLLTGFDLNLTVGSNAMSFLLVLLMVLALYVIKYLVHYLVGLILQIENLGRALVVSYVGIQYALAIVVLPLVLIWYYTDVVDIRMYVEWVLIALVLIMLVWRLVRAISLYWSMFSFAKVYIIFYLCALEITPVLWVVHWALQRG